MAGKIHSTGDVALLGTVAEVLKDYGAEVLQDQERFKATLARLSNFYKPEITSEGINFKLIEHQCAYLYLYFPWHAHSIRQLLGKELGDVFLRDKLKVCSVGGGPGTDFIGLALYLHAHQGKPGKPISGVVLDLYPQWKGIYKAIEQRLAPALQIYLGDVRFLQFDFKQPFSDEVCSEIGEADLVTLIKFVSAVSTNIYSCEKQLQLLLDEMKKNAVLLFIDKSGGRCIKRIENAMEIFEFEKIFEVPFVKFNIPEYENQHLMQELNQQLGYPIIAEGGLTIAAWKKMTDSQTIKL